LDTLKHPFIDLTRLFLRHPGGGIKVLLAIRLLKTSLMRQLPSRFFNAQDPENKVAVLFDTLNHCFIDQQIRFLRRPGGRL
jgi:hypothetical protein